jgi:hypothetical protein
VMASKATKMSEAFKSRSELLAIKTNYKNTLKSLV